MRAFIIHCATIGVLVGSVPNIVWAGSVGRRNTAIAATAIAAGAWANGTGRTGRRNTAILATGGAVYAWSRYNDKKHQEKHRQTVCTWKDGHPVRRDVVVVHEPQPVHREVVVVHEPQPVVHREVVYVPVEEHGKCCKKGPHGHAWGYWKHHHDDDDD